MTLDEDIKIVMTAEDRASDEVQAAAKRINDQYRQMENVNRAVGRSTMLNNQALFQTARVLSTVGHIAGTLTNIYTKWNVMQIRLQDSARDLAEAQEDVSQAFVQSGPDSEQYISAARRLAQVQEDNKRATDEARSGMALFAIETAGSVGMMISALPKLQSFATTIRSIGSATRLAGASMAIGGALPGLTAGAAVGKGVAAGGLAGKLGGIGMGGALGTGLGIAGGAALIGGGIMTSGPMTGDTSNEGRLLSVAQMAGGGALAGLMVGGPIGALIGAAAGGIGGAALNFHEEFGNMFTGQGFVSNADRDRVKNEITINVQGGDAMATANEVARQLQMAQVGR